MIHRPNILRRPVGAFTLIEVLLTVTMVTILLAALQTTLFSALRLRETTNEIFEAELPRHMIIALIKRDMADIVPPPSLPPEPEEGAEEEEPPEEQPPEEGEEEEPEPEIFGPLVFGLLGELDESGGQRADSIRFCTASAVLNEYDPWCDIQQVEYYLVSTGNSNSVDSYDLMRRVNHNLMIEEEEIEEDLYEQALLSNVRSMEISYFDGEEWQDEWDTEALANAMPLAITLYIEFVPPEMDGRYTPPIDLIIPITTQALPFSGAEAAENPEEGDGGSGGGGGDR